MGFIQNITGFGLIFINMLIWNGETRCQNIWTQKSSLPGPGRFDATAFVIGDKAYICTGDTLNSGPSFLNDLWEWDAISDSWTQKANFPGLPRRGSFSFSIGSKGYVGGGSSGIQNFLDFWEYDSFSNAWLQKMSLVGPFQNHILGFSIGNFGYTIFGNFTSDLYKYDPSIDNWNIVSIFPGAPRFYATSFVIGTSVYFGTGSWYKDIWEYNTQSSSWTQKADIPGNKRRVAVSFAIGPKGYLGTGFDTLGTGLDDFHEFDTTSNTWSSIANYPAGPIVYANGFAINGKGYVAMGVGLQPPGFNTLWEYSPLVGIADNVQTKMEVNIYPNPFYNHLTIAIVNEKNFHIYEIYLYDSKGNLVIRNKILSQNYEVNIYNLKSGTYLYTLRDQNSEMIKSGKLICLNKIN